MNHGSKCKLDYIWPTFVKKTLKYSKTPRGLRPYMLKSAYPSSFVLLPHELYCYTIKEQNTSCCCLRSSEISFWSASCILLRSWQDCCRWLNSRCSWACFLRRLSPSSWSCVWSLNTRLCRVLHGKHMGDHLKFSNVMLIPGLKNLAPVQNTSQSWPQNYRMPLIKYRIFKD